MNRLKRLVAALPMLAALVGCAPTRVTTSSLLAELTDLPGLATYPRPGFVCRQFSSYDRRSKTPADHDSWFANGDADNYLRVEDVGGRKEYVMMDADGPGAIVRIWSANPRGTLRIYLDGADEPVIEAPMGDFLSGKYAGIPEPIAHVASRGWNSYFPIPYARHCKVTSDDKRFYYHVDYRTYPAGTPVRSFRGADLERLGKKVATVAERLAAPETAWNEPARRLAAALRRQSADPWHVLPSGESYEWAAERAGPGAIVALAAQVDAADIEAALRQLVLTIEFDGEQTVACPLGDFFGAAPGVNPYASLPMVVADDGTMWSAWVMPFEKTARLRIRNAGAQLVSLQVYVAGRKMRWTTRSMHFHAKWRREADIPTRPMRDWNYLAARGRGVFVGAAFHIANPVKNWWGEGDEKIYVDGENFPSFFGTGTEDYYGYAWCCNVPFANAYHNQPRCDGPGNYGHTAVNRWHIIDKIPFTRDFRFDMELWHWNKDARVTCSVVSYWYARPGATDEFPPIASDNLRIAPIPEYVAPRVAGAIEGEEMKILARTGNPQHQEWGGLSNDTHLWWTGAKPGDRLVLGFEVAEAGRYRVLARFLTAGDYGICQLYLNGAKAGPPIDLYHNGVTPSKERDLGVFDLPAGQNRLGVEVVGSNAQAVKRYMFGLDYLRLEPVSTAN